MGVPLRFEFATTGPGTAPLPRRADRRHTAAPFYRLGANLAAQGVEYEDGTTLALLARILRAIAAGLALRWTAEAANSMAEPAGGEDNAAPMRPGRAMIPVRAAIGRAAVAQEIQRERYRRKNQQKINEGTRGEMHRVVE
jgi:hypothetical protein